MEKQTLKILFLVSLLIGSEVAKLIEPGPTSGVVLQETPGFLIIQSQIVTKKVFASLNPLHILQKHLNSSIFTCTPSTQQCFKAYIQYVTKNVKNILSQLEKVMVQPLQRQNIRPKRLQGQGKTIQDTVMVVNLHSHKIDLNIAELFVLKSTFNKDHTFMQHMYELTYDMLKELDNSISNLIQGKIPRYLVSSDVICDAFSKVIDMHIEPIQIQIAFHLGTAVPLYVDVDNMEIAYVLNLPFILPENVYQLKQIINVGTWKDDFYLRVDTPKYIAYKHDDPQQYLVTNLALCQKTKDIHWLCSGNPFLKDTFCGLAHPNVQEKCKVTVTKHADFSDTTVAIVNNVWLISTPETELTVTMIKHEVNNHFPLPSNVCFIAVPQHSVVHVGGLTLSYIDSDPVISEIEIMDVFRGHPIDFAHELSQMMSFKDSYSIELAVNHEAIRIANYDCDSSRLDIAADNSITTIVVLVFAFLWAILFLFTIFLMREIYALRCIIR